MDVVHWYTFPDELRAGLIQAYPSVIWRTQLWLDDGNAACGVAVWARRNGSDVEIHVPEQVIALGAVHDLVEEIYGEADKLLASSGRA